MSPVSSSNQIPIIGGSFVKYKLGECANNQNHSNRVQELTEVSNIVTATEGNTLF